MSNKDEKELTAPVGEVPEEKSVEDTKDLTGEVAAAAAQPLEPVEAVETAEEVPAEAPEAAEAPAEAQEEYSAAEGTDASLLSEFAPKPMNIPNVDLEKEKKRQEKRDKNRDREKKKVEARKNRSKSKKISAGQKIAAGIASFVLFMVMTVTMTGLVSSLSVQMATSRYAFHLAVDNMDVAEIAIDSPDYQALGENFDMVKSSGRAALVDIIRDNSQVQVTYNEIVSSIERSDMESFIETNLKSAADYLLLDKPYTPVTGADIANVVNNSRRLVYSLTGKQLTEEDCAKVAAYFENSGKLEDVSLQNLSAVGLRQYTQYTRHLFSVKILGAILLLNILLIVLLVVLGRKTAHIPIGWAFILSGIAVIAGAILFKPAYVVRSGFLQTVLNNYFNFFTMAVIIIAGIFTVTGACVFLIGNAATDRDDD